MVTAGLRSASWTLCSPAALTDTFHRLPDMRLLAVSYMLPPALYPQAIQIGRLLTNLPVEVGAVCGEVTELSAGLDSYAGFAGGLAFCLNVEFRPLVAGFAARVARRFLPFYGDIPDEFRGWVPRAERAVEEKLRAGGFRPDILVTFGVPMSDHLLGLRLKPKLGVPWIAHFSDPWSDNSFRHHKILSNFINRRLERQVIAEADAIIFPSVEMLDLVMRKYPENWRAKTAVLPHSFDPALHPQPTLDARGPVLRYLGNFYGHRSPAPLFRALKAILATEPELLDGIRVELVGQMPRRMRLHPALRALPQGLVQVRDTVPYSQALSLMSNSDLLLVIDGLDDLSVFLPSKLVEYLGSGTPIFGIVPPGTSARLLARMGAAVSDPRKPEEVVEGLRQALRLVRARRALPVPGPWGDPAVREEFRAERVRSAFVGILNQVLQHSPVATAASTVPSC